MCVVITLVGVVEIGRSSPVWGAVIFLNFLVDTIGWVNLKGTERGHNGEGDAKRHKLFLKWHAAVLHTTYLCGILLYCILMWYTVVLRTVANYKAKHKLGSAVPSLNHLLFSSKKMCVMFT